MNSETHVLEERGKLMVERPLTAEEIAFRSRRRDLETESRELLQLIKSIPSVSPHPSLLDDLNERIEEYAKEREAVVDKAQNLIKPLLAQLHKLEKGEAKSCDVFDVLENTRRERVELLEAAIPIAAHAKQLAFESREPFEAEVANAKQALEATIVQIEEEFEGMGYGISRTQAGRMGQVNSPAAKRQFDARVRDVERYEDADTKLTEAKRRVSSIRDVENKAHQCSQKIKERLNLLVNKSLAL